MSEFTNNESELIEKLRRGLQESDPVPETVGEFAKALFTWRDIDAELAEMAFDSADEETPSGVRSTAVVRMISFQAGQWLVDVEYDEAKGHLTGRISPDTQGTVELHSSGAHFAVESDKAGHFSFEGVGRGPVSLVIVFEKGQAVKTNWVIL